MKINCSYVIITISITINSVMKSDRNSFCVLDSVNIAFREEDDFFDGELQICSEFYDTLQQGTH